VLIKLVCGFQSRMEKKQMPNTQKKTARREIGQATSVRTTSKGVQRKRREGVGENSIKKSKINVGTKKSQRKKVSVATSLGKGGVEKGGVRGVSCYYLWLGRAR